MYAYKFYFSLSCVFVLFIFPAFSGCNGGGGGDEDSDVEIDGVDIDIDPDSIPDADVSAEDAVPDREEDITDGTDDMTRDEGPSIPVTVRIDPSDSHRFIAGGEPLYLAGYYPAVAALTIDQTDYENYYRSYIDKLSGNQCNYFRQVFSMGQPIADAMIPYERTGPGDAADGRPKVDLTLYNDTCFDYWRTVVEYARSNDVVVQVTIFDAWHNKQWVVEDNGPGRVWGMQYDFYNGTNNINDINTQDVDDWTNPAHAVFDIQKDMIRKVVDALGYLPNIIWEICNENGYNEDWEIQLADFLTDYENSLGLDPHLVMPRDLPNHDSAGGKTNDPSTTHNELVSNFSMGQPLIADNDGGGHVNADGRRHKAWAALTAGGHVDYFHYEMFLQSVLDSADVTDGMKYAGYTRKFIDDLGVDLRDMGPSDDLVSSGWCLAAPGERFIVYLLSGGTTTIDGLPGAFEAWWFNPRDGSSSTAEGGPDFIAPDSEDWVLFVMTTP